MLLYRGFHKQNIPVDIISKDRDLSSYKVVIAPALFVLTEERANALRNYVQSGGTLVLTFRSAVKDKTGLIFDEPLPGLLQDVFGAVVKEYHSPEPNETNSIWGKEEAVDGGPSDATVWLDIMERKGADSIAHYDNGFAPGQVAITRNKFGAGTAYYMGTQPSQEFCLAFMNLVATQAGIVTGIETPEGVDASVRTGESADFLFIVNHTDEHKTVARPDGFLVDVLRDTSAPDQIRIDPYDVVVLRATGVRQLRPWCRQNKVALLQRIDPYPSPGVQIGLPHQAAPTHHRPGSSRLSWDRQSSVSSPMPMGHHTVRVLQSRLRTAKRLDHYRGQAPRD